MEQLEDRRLLATLSVNSSIDSGAIVDDGILRLREAIAYVNGTNPGPLDGAWINTSDPFGKNDTIVFASNVYGDTFYITGSALSISKQVQITGPTGSSNRITIQKDPGSTAIQGLLFENFDLSPVGGFSSTQTGVSNLAISGFTVGIKAEDLTSNGFNPEQPLRIINNVITNVATGIWLENADVPFHIESNVLLRLD